MLLIIIITESFDWKFFTKHRLLFIACQGIGPKFRVKTINESSIVRQEILQSMKIRLDSRRGIKWFVGSGLLRFIYSISIKSVDIWRKVMFWNDSFAFPWFPIGPFIYYVSTFFRLFRPPSPYLRKYVFRSKSKQKLEFSASLPIHIESLKQFKQNLYFYGRAGHFGQCKNCFKIWLWILNRLTHIQFNVWGRV